MDVLIVDDHPIIHQTLESAVRAERPEASVRGAFDLQGGLQLAGEMSGDALVLLDLGLPDCSGIEVLHRFLAAFPGMRIAIVSATEAGTLVSAALKAGAAGYIPKTSLPEVIVAALRVIIAGGIYIPPQILADLPQPPEFTGRQLEVLQLILSGSSNQDIALTLGIAENTVKQHAHAVFQVLNVSSRTQAILAAVRLGIEPAGGKF